MSIKVADNGSSHLLDKHVILCRSGKQIYHKSEVEKLITKDNHPPKEKEYYVEYRPPSVVVKAKDLCATLPVTKEHPSEFVDGSNFNQLAGGVTDKSVEVVALSGESEGEIGLSTSITFFNNELYDYYNQENKEVSLGYECLKHFVNNPEECGYDIVLDDIVSVNHLAITQAGRGGSSVAVVDNVKSKQACELKQNKAKGVSKMRTKLFERFFKKQTDSFGKATIDALKAGKDAMTALDSVMLAQDSAEKQALCDMVNDCFDHKEVSLANAESIISELDTAYKTFTDSLNDPTAEKNEEKSADKGDKSKVDDSTEDKDDDDKSKNKITDSAPTVQVDTAAIVNALRGDIEKIVTDTIKSTLGVTDSKSKVEGGVVDVTDGIPVTFDYSEFLD